jgi:hypothetical protein
MNKFKQNKNKNKNNKNNNNNNSNKSMNALKLNGQLKSMLLGVNVNISSSTWDIRPLSNISAGTSENERIGQKVQLKELRCRQKI